LSSSPEGVVSLAPGDAAIKLAASAGLYLDDWQQHVLRQSLGVRADGKWAAFSACVIVPRQNGKGSILEALALASLFLFENELTIWTAHQMKTAKEGFRRLVTLISGTPDLARKVRQIKNGNDDRGIELLDGRRIQFIARGSGGSGRGWTSDLLLLDEAFELDGDTMADILPTLSAVPNPQIWYMSSAPMVTSEQLHSVRNRGIRGDDRRLAFFEWSTPGDLDPTSVETWALANPGFPHRISAEAIASEWDEFNADDDPSKFCRERLGHPDEPASFNAVIDAATWDALAEKSTIASHRCWALSVSPDRRWSTFGIAGRREDGRLHVEWLERRAGTDWVLDYAVDVFGRQRIPLRVHKSGPESSFIAPLKERGVDVVEVSSAEVAQATGQFIDAANGGGLRHLGQAALTTALRGAVLRTSTDGAALWSQRSSQVEITALMACTVAAGGVPAEMAHTSGVFVDLDDY
jgi:phage terminase large subunit-like protein